jgi:hypothetical protein
VGRVFFDFCRRAFTGAIGGGKISRERKPARVEFGRGVRKEVGNE